MNDSIQKATFLTFILSFNMLPIKNFKTFSDSSLIVNSYLHQMKKAFLIDKTTLYYLFFLLVGEICLSAGFVYLKAILSFIK